MCDLNYQLPFLLFFFGVLNLKTKFNSISEKQGSLDLTFDYFPLTYQSEKSHIVSFDCFSKATT